jgi:uridine kinase
MPAFVIGIGGGSASGKSTIAGEIKARLAPLQVEVINQDRYFLPNDRLPRHANRRGTKEWPDHNHPESFDLPRLRAELRAARDHSSDVVIAEGILILCDDEVRSLMDLKLYVEADADERIVRRIRRNVARGHDLDGICDFYLDSVRYRHQEFNAPTKAHADLVIPGGKDESEKRERLLKRVVRLVLAKVAGGQREANAGDEASLR